MAVSDLWANFRYGKGIHSLSDIRNMSKHEMEGGNMGIVFIHFLFPCFAVP